MNDSPEHNYGPASAPVRVIIRRSRSAYPGMCRHLIVAHNFSDLARIDQDDSMKSKWSHLAWLVRDSVSLIRSFENIRKAQVIVVFDYIYIPVLLLARLRLLGSCERVYIMGFFIHAPVWFRPLRWVLSVLDSAKARYVVFSQCERQLYRKTLLLPVDRIVYLPYGQWKKEESARASIFKVGGLGESIPYYFSGGYSDRDYESLINAFRDKPYRLIIICSSLNRNMRGLALSRNIEVLRDVPSDMFDAYIQGAKACILPVLHNTGAAGQSCLLRFMMNRKPIIATGTDIVREYIEDRVSGILVNNNIHDLAGAIEFVEQNQAMCASFGEVAYERFRQQFSYEAISHRLSEIIEGLV